MFKNYLTTALRTILKNKLISVINIIGLSVGVAASLVIFLYLRGELSYDNHFKETEDVYRILFHFDNGEEQAVISGAFYHTFHDKIPEIEAVSSMYYNQNSTLKSENKKALGTVVYVDSCFLTILNYKLKYGSPEEIFKKPNALILSSKYASLLFGDINPIGKSITIENKVMAEVTGVLEPIPHNTSLQFDAIGLRYIGEQLNYRTYNSWYNQSIAYYTRLKKESDPILVGNKLKDIWYEHFKEYDGVGFRLQALKDTYLHSTDIDWNFYLKSGSASHIRLFTIIAQLILLIAIFNYINLSTARVTSRIKEIGIRKVIGANKNNLFTQFMTESFLISFISLWVGRVLAELAIPAVNKYSGANLELGIFSMETFVFLTPGALILTFLTGTNPSLIMSKPSPIAIFNKTLGFKFIRHFSSKKFKFREILVGVQFFISIALIISTLICLAQLHFMKNFNKGFDGNNILIINNPWIKVDEMNFRYKQMKSKMENSGLPIKMGAANNLPPGQLNNQTLFYDISDPDGIRVQSHLISTDFEMLSIFRAQLLEGRYFDKKFPFDSVSSVIVSQSFTDALNLKNPIGTTINGFFDNKERKIVGVIKDMHYYGAHIKVKPQVFCMEHELPYSPELAFSYHPKDHDKVMNFITKSWNEIAPDWPIQYDTPSDRSTLQNRKETNFYRLFGFFSVLAIFISGLGLFGLSIFSAQNKYKEIGIRKVLGAPVRSIILVVSKRFIVVFMIANILAWPLAYMIMDKWLRNFAYKEPINFKWFFMATLIALFIAGLTMLYEMYKAARTNPAEVIKYE